MRRITALMFVCLVGLNGYAVSAQATATPEPTYTPMPTATATPEPFTYATLAPIAPATDGQMTRFDYVASAGDVHVANLLTLMLFSMWGFFLFAVFVLVVFARRK